MYYRYLVELPNGMDNIIQSLEREYALRKFNVEHLKMEVISGSEFERTVGVGVREDAETKTSHPIHVFYPSVINHVIQTFVLYPVAKIFGIGVDDAMALPVDYWYKIKKSAEAMPLNKHTDMEAELMDLMKQILTAKEGPTG